MRLRQVVRYLAAATMSIGLGSLLFLQCAYMNPSPSKTIVVDSAGVACAESLAARAGEAILREGGNAVDAAVTVAFALAVTYPRAGNLGGGGFLLFRNRTGEVHAIDFRETAPAAATVDMYWDEQGNPVAEKSLIGALAAGVPGTVRGLYLAHRKYGRLPWKKLLQPAIRLARDGFVVYEDLSRSLNSKEAIFRRFPESYRIFFPHNNSLRPGDTLRQPDLARTLEQIAEHGDTAFYEGEIARQIARTVQRYGGIITEEDLRSYRAVEREPVVIDYRGYRIYSMPPPSSGGLVLQGILNTLQFVALNDSFAHNRADYLAFLSEVEKQWYARRNLYLGDPDFVEIPYHLFSDPEQAREVFRRISTERPLPSRQMPEFRRIAARNGEHSQTTHLSVVDAEGNAVSMTYTLNGSYGSCLVAEGTGVLLNNEMDDFAARPGHPNMFGLVQGWANAIEPGKRMLSSMTPTIVEKDGELVGLVGTPGGSTIITSVLQILLNKIDYRMSLAEAQAAGRFHHQWLPDTIFYEQGKFDEGVLRELERRGFSVQSRPRLGDIQAIWRTEAGWEVSSDPRGNGFPTGY